MRADTWPGKWPISSEIEVRKYDYWRCWKYGSEVFTWASEVLFSATPCDLLLVDEVGPLELLGNRGWVSALDVLRRGDFQAALVVCRPSLMNLLEDAIERPPAGSFEADLEKIDGLSALIVGAMFD